MPQIVALFMAMLVAVWGCASEPGATFTASLRDESGQVVPVIVYDETATVEVVDSAPSDATVSPGVANAPGAPDVLVATWLGGTCDRRVNFDFTGDGRTYTLRGRTLRDSGCTLTGITRSIVLKLKSSVQADSVTFIGP